MYIVQPSSDIIFGINNATIHCHFNHNEHCYLEQWRIVVIDFTNIDLRARHCVVYAMYITKEFMSVRVTC